MSCQAWVLPGFHQAFDWSRTACFAALLICGSSPAGRPKPCPLMSLGDAARSASPSLRRPPRGCTALGNIRPSPIAARGPRSGASADRPIGRRIHPDAPVPISNIHDDAHRRPHHHAEIRGAVERGHRRRLAAANRQGTDIVPMARVRRRSHGVSEVAVMGSAPPIGRRRGQGAKPRRAKRRRAFRARDDPAPRRDRRELRPERSRTASIN